MSTMVTIRLLMRYSTTESCTVANAVRGREHVGAEGAIAPPLCKPSNFHLLLL